MISAEKIMAIVPEEVFDALTEGHGSQGDRARLLGRLAVQMYGAGYEDGLHRGAQLLRDAVVAKLDTPEPSA